MFATHLKTGSATIEAHYRPKKNTTIIMAKSEELNDDDTDDDCDTRPVRLEIPGLIIPMITTNGGISSITY